MEAIVRWMVFAFALSALVTGLVAAWRWYQSSQVPLAPGWTLPGQGGGIEPLDEACKAIGWSMAILQSQAEAAALNRKAALWTAGSVLLGGLSAAIGSLPLT